MDVVLLYVSGVVLTTLCTLGIFGNTITLFILNVNREMRKQPINVYLTVLALFDNGVLFNAILMLGIPSLYRLLSPLPPHLDGTTLPSAVSMTNSTASWTWTEVFPDIENEIDGFGNETWTTFSVEPRDQDGNWTNVTAQEDLPTPDYPSDPLHLYIRFVYPLALISQTGSIWTTCLITAERYLAVCHPLRALTLSTRSRAMWALGALSLCAVIYNLPRFAEVEIAYKDGFPEVKRSSLRQDPVYIWLYHICSYLALLYIIPLSLLSVLNTKIYMAVRKATRDRSNLTRHQESELNIASMLTLLVAIFIACNAPAFIVNCLEVIETPHFQVAATFSNLLVCFNSSINFIIYCIFGKKFREKLKEVLQCRVTRPRLRSISARNQFGASFVGETFV